MLKSLVSRLFAQPAAPSVFLAPNHAKVYQRYSNAIDRAPAGPARQTLIDQRRRFLERHIVST